MSSHPRRPDDADRVNAGGDGPGGDPPGPYADEPRPGPPRWDLYEDPEPPRSAGGRRWALLVLAVLPWLVIAAALLRPAPGAEAPSDPELTEEPAGDVDPDDPTATEAADGPSALDIDPWADLTGDGSGDPGSAIPADEPLPEIDAIRIGGRATPGTGEAAALAILIARAWLGDVGAPLETELGAAGTDAYVEHLVVEAVDFPAPGAAVVSVVAVLLDVADGAYTDARPVRVGVPVHLGRDGARPAGSPWWLPPPDLRPEDDDWRTVDDQTVLADAGAALAAAGYHDIAVERLEHAGGWALRVTARAVAPGREAPGEHVLWLREHLGDLVVAGWLPEPTAHGDAPGEGPVPPPEPEPGSSP